MNWWHAGTGLGGTDFSLIEIAEDKLRFLFQGSISNWALKLAEGELGRGQYEFTDLDGDGTKEIVVERFDCQVILRDAGWEEQWCEPYASEIYRYDGVKYLQQPEDEGSTTTDTP